MTQYTSYVREWTTKAGVKRRARLHPAVCACGRVRYLPKTEAVRNPPCYHCSQRAKAKQAWKVTEALLSPKYGGLTGRRLWVAMERKRAESRPMASELRMSDLLTGIPYERNVEIDCGDHSWVLDFLIGGRIALEVNGGIHRLHQQRDSRKYSDLLRLGYSVIVVEDSDLSLDWLWKTLV